MSFSKPPRGMKEEWQDAARDPSNQNIKLFFIKLYGLKNFIPHWGAIEEALIKTRCMESLDFFIANLERTRNPSFTLKDWYVFYEKWIAPADGLGAVINITAHQLDALQNLHKQISLLNKDDVIDFNKISISTKFDRQEILNGNQLLDIISTKLLVMVNNDKKFLLTELLEDLDIQAEIKKPKEQKEKKETTDSKASKK